MNLNGNKSHLHELNLEYVFPSPIWNVDLDCDLQAIHEYCLKFRDENMTTIKSNRGLESYQSADICASCEILKGGEFGGLLKTIEMYANTAYKTFQPSVSSLKMSNAWININGLGASQIIHTHPSSILAGVFYVSIPTGQDCGSINFYRNMFESFSIKSLNSGSLMQENPHSSVEHSYKPVENRLFLFPSWMPHGVGVNTNEKDRISVSFNLVN